MEGAEGHDRATLGRIVELERAVGIEIFRDFIPREILAQRMHAIGPAVRQHQALGIGMSHRFDADQVADFALRPVGRRNRAGDAVDPRVIGRQVSEHAAQQVILVECEIVRHQEISRERPVIRSDADHVAGIEIAKEMPADALHLRRIDVQEQTAVTGTVRPWNGGAELFPQLFEPVRCDHISAPSRSLVRVVPELARRQPSGSSV